MSAIEVTYIRKGFVSVEELTFRISEYSNLNETSLRQFLLGPLADFSVAPFYHLQVYCDVIHLSRGNS